MVSFVKPQPSDWKDHDQLMSAATAHKRNIAKTVPSDTDRLCANLAGAVLDAPFLLDASPEPKLTELPQQNAAVTRVASFFKRLS